MNPMKVIFSRKMFWLGFCLLAQALSFSMAFSDGPEKVFYHEAKASFRPISDNWFKDCSEWNTLFLEQAKQVELVEGIASDLSASLDQWSNASEKSPFSLTSLYASLADQQRKLREETLKLEKVASSEFFEQEGWVQWLIPVSSIADEYGAQLVRADLRPSALAWDQLSIRDVAVSVRHELRYPDSEGKLLSHGMIDLSKDSLLVRIPFRPVDRCLVVGLRGAGAIPSGEKGRLEKSLLQFSLDQVGRWESTQGEGDLEEKRLTFSRNVVVELDSEKVWSKPWQDLIQKQVDGDNSKTCIEERKQKDLTTCVGIQPLPHGSDSQHN